MLECRTPGRQYACLHRRCRFPGADVRSHQPAFGEYARFDKGFGGEDFYRLWERRHIGYVGKLKWTKRLAAEVTACRYWKRYVDDEDWVIEGITLIYKATSWNKPRRVAIIRKAQVVDDGQTRLIFDTDWQYEAIVTNLEWEPIDLWRFYNQRCCMENYIKEAKSGFSIDRIATGDFEANELDLLIKLPAYNLYERFRGGMLRTRSSRVHHCPVSLRVFPLRGDDHPAQPSGNSQADAGLCQSVCPEANRSKNRRIRMSPPQFYMEIPKPLLVGRGRNYFQNANTRLIHWKIAEIFPSGYKRCSQWITIRDGLSKFRIK